jgi:hypothetical protein
MHRRRILLAALYVAAYGLLAGVVSDQVRAQSTDPETAHLMGAPVFASDGVEVGEVADFSTDEGGRVNAIKLRTGQRLGFGAKTVVMQQGMFIVLRGAVVLDFPAEALEALPDTDASPRLDDDK